MHMRRNDWRQQLLRTGIYSLDAIFDVTDSFFLLFVILVQRY